MKKKGILLGLTSILLSAGLTSCGLFGSGEYALDSYETSYDNETGNTYITFYFTDEDRDPFVVTIPQGFAGKDGISIESATVTENPDDQSYTITIVYTDPSIPPTVLEIPYYEGITVTGITVDRDENKQVTIQFVYSDGSKSDVITIPSGNGIASYTTAPTADGIMITIVFTDPDMEPMTFELKNGTSISSIIVDPSKQTETKYCFTIIFTDGYMQDVYFDKPTTTKWYYGVVDPTPTTPYGANNGDFYLNYLSGWVFVKSNGVWNAMFCMKADQSTNIQYCQILFDPNGGHWDGGSEGMIMTTAQIGQTIPLSNIPLPEKDGSVFAGWFVDPTNPNSGQFTDLTVVTQGLTLLAKWVA